MNFLARFRTFPEWHSFISASTQLQNTEASIMAAYKDLCDPVMFDLMKILFNDNIIAMTDCLQQIIKIDNETIQTLKSGNSDLQNLYEIYQSYYNVKCKADALQKKAKEASVLVENTNMKVINLQKKSAPANQINLALSEHNSAIVQENSALNEWKSQEPMFIQELETYQKKFMQSLTLIIGEEASNLSKYASSIQKITDNMKENAFEFLFVSDMPDDFILVNSVKKMKKQIERGKLSFEDKIQIEEEDDDLVIINENEGGEFDSSDDEIEPIVVKVPNGTKVEEIAEPTPTNAEINHDISIQDELIELDESTIDSFSSSFETSRTSSFQKPVNSDNTLVDEKGDQNNTEIIKDNALKAEPEVEEPIDYSSFLVDSVLFESYIIPQKKLENIASSPIAFNEGNENDMSNTVDNLFDDKNDKNLIAIEEPNTPRESILEQSTKSSTIPYTEDYELTPSIDLEIDNKQFSILDKSKDEMLDLKENEVLLESFPTNSPLTQDSQSIENEQDSTQVMEQEKENNTCGIEVVNDLGINTNSIESQHVEQNIDVPQVLVDLPPPQPQILSQEIPIEMNKDIELKESIEQKETDYSDKNVIEIPITSKPSPKSIQKKPNTKNSSSSNVAKPTKLPQKNSTKHNEISEDSDPLHIEQFNLNKTKAKPSPLVSNRVEPSAQPMAKSPSKRPRKQATGKSTKKSSTKPQPKAEAKVQQVTPKSQSSADLHDSSKSKLDIPHNTHSSERINEMAKEKKKEKQTSDSSGISFFSSIFGMNPFIVTQEDKINASKQSPHHKK